MKKIVCITALVLLVTLLLCGCADRQPQGKTDNARPGETAREIPVESGTLPKETATEIVKSGTGLQDQQNTTGNVSSVTLEELDKLKADIEGLEAEDLGGFYGE